MSKPEKPKCGFCQSNKVTLIFTVKSIEFTGTITICKDCGRCTSTEMEIDEHKRIS